MSTSSSTPTSLPTIPSVVTVRLSRDNHLIWKAQFLTYLRTHGLMGITFGNEPAPAKTLEQVSDTGAYRVTNQVENPLYVA